MAMHADLGDTVTTLICTDGERHHPDMFLDDEEAPGRTGDARFMRGTLDDIRALKRREAKRVAKILGVSELVLLGWPDDEYMEITQSRVKQLRDVILRVRPDVLVTHLPLSRQAPYDAHTSVGQMVLRAIATAATRIRQVDGVAAHRVKEVFFMPMGGEIADSRSTLCEGIVCDVWIDITPVVARKVQAMDQIISQRYEGQAARKIVESREGRWGMLAGVSYAEPFLRSTGHTYTSLPMLESVLDKEFVPNDLPGDLITAHDVPLAAPSVDDLLGP
jgi:LmbE family N-acetylglucosaminyl deacetylase